MIQIPFIIDNNKNVTPVNRVTGECQSQNEKITTHLYQQSQNIQNGVMQFESLDGQKFNVPMDNNMSSTSFRSIEQATASTGVSQSQLFSPSKSYAYYHKNMTDMAFAQLMGPGSNVEIKEEFPQPQNQQQIMSYDDQTGNNNTNDNSNIKSEQSVESKNPSSSSTQSPISNLINQKPPVYTKWTEREDELLREAVNIYGPHKWSLVATNVPNRTPMQCSARWVGALNPSILKGRWTAQEDSILTETVQQYLNAVDSQGNPQPIPWNKVSKRIPQRTGAQCQARWTEALDPNIKKGKWSPQEDEILKEGVRIYGRCWIRIAEMIEGRTQRQCRTRWLQIKNKQAKLKTESTSNNSDSTSKNNNVLILTPPTTTPSTPSQPIKNYSSSPSIIQGRIMAPSQIGNTFANITQSHFITSPEIYQSPVFSSPSTPAESPGYSNLDITNFLTTSDSTNFVENSQIIFQSPQSNPLCFYDNTFTFGNFPSY